MEILGIDIGGSGIKAAIVETKSGQFVGDRYRLDTPQPANPENVALAVKQITKKFKWFGKIGCGFPAVIQNGIIKTAANIDKSFIGIDANKLFSKTTKCDVFVFNDADSAGFAELTFNDEKKHKGLTIFLTIGTGIGSALIKDGVLIPNTEFGHLYMQNGMIGEKFASDAVRKNQDLSWEDWAKRFNEYLLHLEKIFNPTLFIIGGGTSKKIDKFQSLLSIKTEIKPAKFMNNAGIIGAALLTKSIS